MEDWNRNDHVRFHIDSEKNSGDFQKENWRKLFVLDVNLEESIRA